MHFAARQKIEGMGGSKRTERYEIYYAVCRFLTK